MYKSLNKLIFVITLSAIISACGTLKNVEKEIGQTTEIGHTTRDVVKETTKAIKEN